MPELPEVETTVRKLKPLLIGKRVLDFDKKILGVERRGKAILIWLDNRVQRRNLQDTDIFLLKNPSYSRQSRSQVPANFAPNPKFFLLAFHQRMSGRLLIVERAHQDKYIRRRFRLSGGKDLAFHDVRRFGIVWYGPAKKVLEDNYFKTLGKDALDISLTNFKELLSRKSNPLNPPYSKGDTKRRNISYGAPLKVRGAEGGYGQNGNKKIKSFLLDQKNIAGIGNIMADEILWHAKINPERQISSLADNEIKLLWRALRSVLQKSIKLGGSSMRDWLHPDGSSGGYFEKRKVYGREGEACPRCKAKILRKKIAGRSSYYCARCQIKK